MGAAEILALVQAARFLQESIALAKKGDITPEEFLSRMEQIAGSIEKAEGLWERAGG